MTVSLKHNFVSTKGDPSDTDLIGATKWNAEHDLTMATNRVLGRTSSGTGAVEELDAAALTTFLGLGSLATQSGTFSGTSSGTNTGDQNVFSTIAVSGQSNVVADTTSDTLTLVAGSNITITTDASADSITIASTGGGTPAGSGTEIQYRDGSSFGAMSGTAWDNTNRSLTITGATITANAPLLNVSQTWNNGAVTFHGVYVDITATAAGASSSLMTLRSGGVNRVTVGSTGALTVNGGSILLQNASGTVQLVGMGTGGGQNGVSVPSTYEFGILSSTTAFGSADTRLGRGAAGVWSVRAGSTTTGGTIQHIPNRPAQITADQNNYNPGNVSKFQHFTTDAARTLTGLTFTAAQVDGQEHVIVNVGSNNIVLSHQNASSTAGNRFLCSTGADITLSANQAAEMHYDSTQARWLVFKRN